MRGIHKEARKRHLKEETMKIWLGRQNVPDADEKRFLPFRYGDVDLPHIKE